MKLKYLFYFLMAVMLLESCSKDDSRDMLSLKLNRTRLELAKGATKQLVATVTPYVEEPVMWKSTMPDVATVDSTGFVTAIGEGKTVITASMRDLTASCELTVINVTVDSIVLYRNELKLGPGDTYVMKATVVPAAAPQDVEWRSDNEQVVTVDEEGVITAIALGTAKIYAKAGDKEAYCTVDVSNTVATFEELKEIFDSAEPGRTVTITLTNDIEMTDGITISQENNLAREFIINGNGHSFIWQTDNLMFRADPNQSLIFNNVIFDGNNRNSYSAYYFLYTRGGSMTFGPGTAVKNVKGYSTYICALADFTNGDEIVNGTLIMEDGSSITGNNGSDAVYMFTGGRTILKGGNVSGNMGYATINMNPKNPAGKIYIANALPEGTCFEIRLVGPEDGAVVVSGWEGYQITESDLEKIVLKGIGMYGSVTNEELYLEDGVIKIHIP